MDPVPETPLRQGGRPSRLRCELTSPLVWCGTASGGGIEALAAVRRIPLVETLVEHFNTNDSERMQRQGAQQGTVVRQDPVTERPLSLQYRQQG